MVSSCFCSCPSDVFVIPYRLLLHGLKRRLSQLDSFVTVAYPKDVTPGLKTCTFMQSYSKRVANAKSDKYHQNIHKRGKVFEGKEVTGSSHFLSSYC